MLKTSLHPKVAWTLTVIVNFKSKMNNVSIVTLT